MTLRLNFLYKSKYPVLKEILGILPEANYFGLIQDRLDIKVNLFDLKPKIVIITISLLLWITTSSSKLVLWRGCKAWTHLVCIILLGILG